MTFKSRKEPLNLIKLKYLNNRMDLNEKERQYLYSLQKGYEGEVNFDLLTEKLQTESYVLNDLLLETNNSEFQIDTTMVSQAKLFLFEVKNYDGEHFYKPEEERFIKFPNKDINNPLHQLKRKETLLRQFLKQLGYNIPIEPYLIFINPEFTLLQAPINSTIILPTQLNQFMKKLDNLPSKLGVMHRKLAEQLVSAHKDRSKNAQELEYEYDQVQKGLTCRTCNSFMITIKGNKLLCDVCGNQEKIESAVIRTVEEIKLLFPEINITTNVVQEWCRVIESKKMLGRILNVQYKSIGYGQWTYYE